MSENCFKIERPIVIKSIYTEEESQAYVPYTLNTEYEEGEEDCIYNFIQGSKSLKEKIQERLDHKKKRKANISIKETTFRPTIKAKPGD